MKKSLLIVLTILFSGAAAYAQRTAPGGWTACLGSVSQQLIQWNPPEPEDHIGGVSFTWGEPEGNQNGQVQDNPVLMHFGVQADLICGQIGTAEAGQCKFCTFWDMRITYMDGSEEFPAVNKDTDEPVGTGLQSGHTLSCGTNKNLKLVDSFEISPRVDLLTSAMAPQRVEIRLRVRFGECIATWTPDVVRTFAPGAADVGGYWADPAFDL